MKLKEFVKMFKNCSLLKEQEESSTETVKCFGQKGHDTSFEEMVSLIFQYASDNNLASYAFDVSQMTGDTCSIELFELIKKVQKDLGFTGSAVDGIGGKKAIANAVKRKRKKDGDRDRRGPARNVSNRPKKKRW